MKTKILLTLFSLAILACSDGTQQQDESTSLAVKIPNVKVVNPEQRSFTSTLQIIGNAMRSEEHTSELQSQAYLVCRLLLEKKKKKTHI